MVVVILVGILAVMAIPAMGDARIDQHAYNDATLVADLVREARVHAIGRGAATLVTLSASSSDPGTFTMYEAIGADTANETTGKGTSPRTTCRAPTDWTKTSSAAPNDVWARQVGQQIKLGNYESTYRIGAKVYVDTGTPSKKDQVHICFTPLGRSYLVTTAAPVFDAAAPMTGIVEVELARRDTSAVLVGLARRVLIPPSGSARLLSTAVALP